MNGTALLLSKRVFLLFRYSLCIILFHPLSASAESVTYQYDALRRLTAATYASGIAISYTYDAAGNRLQKTVTTSSASAKNSDIKTAASSLNMAETGTSSNSNSLSINTNSNSNTIGSATSQVSGSQNISNSGIINNQGIALKDPIPSTVVYEDAEDGNITRWGIYNGPSGAFVNNIYDSDRESRVIEVSGDGLLNGFRLLKGDGTSWNNSKHQIIQWSMKYSTYFVISVAAQTTNGLRYLSFTPKGENALGTGTNIFYGLGGHSKNGSWHTYIIDLGYELHKAQPNTTILSLLGFYVSGNGLLDDIQTHKTIPANLDSDGDGVTDIKEMKAGTNPYRKGK